MLTNLPHTKNHPGLFSLALIRYSLKLLPLGRIFYTQVPGNRYVKALVPYSFLMRARLNIGISMTVDVKDYNGRCLYLCGIVYPEVIDTCRALLRSGDSFLDIGANYGTVGLSCLESVGANGAVHLFEPQPELCQRIQSAIEEFNLKPVKIHKVGLLDRDDMIELSLPENHSGGASFVSNMHNKATKKIRLEVKNIATYLPSIIGEQGFGAKVDVEGAEPYILPWLIQQERLRFIVFENLHFESEERTNLFEEMINNGFTLFGVKNVLARTYLYLINDYQRQLDYQDIVAVRLNSSASLPNRITPTKLHELQKIDVVL